MDFIDKIKDKIQEHRERVREHNRLMELAVRRLRCKNKKYCILENIECFLAGVLVGWSGIFAVINNYIYEIPEEQGKYLVLFALVILMFIILFDRKLTDMEYEEMERIKYKVYANEERS